MPASPEYGRPGGYDSPFGNWEARASVRNKPRRTFIGAQANSPFFPPEMIPAVGHPRVAERGPAVSHQVSVHSLYQYLHFTTVLEQVTVLPVTTRLSLNQAGVEVPEPMRADAFKITTDEAWHAQICYDFTRHVAEVTGIAPAAVVPPAFIRRLEQLRAEFEPSARPLIDLVFAVVSETLVSSLLSDIPTDRRLPRPVRELVADHAADEGRHHSFFQNFLRLLWPKIPERQRLEIGPRIPAFIEAFLYPDQDASRQALIMSGLSSEEASSVIAESYPPQSPAFHIQKASRGTVRGFRDVGALADPRAAEAFAAAELLVCP